MLNPELLMANLSHGQHKELVLVNTSEQPVIVSWQSAQNPALIWYDSQANKVTSTTLIVNSRDWLIGANQE
jgi:hypothetical protein